MVDELTITLFYHNHGYTWTHIDITYNLAAYHLYHMYKDSVKVLHYVNKYKPWTETKEYVLENYSQHIDVYNIWHSMFRNEYIPTHDGLKSRLVDILNNYIGYKAQDVVNRNWPMFQMAFTSASVSPGTNYEFIEAIGDGFLDGYYMWYLLDTPGIITPDQVTKMRAYFQNATQLSKLVSYLDIKKYIQVGKGTRLTEKIESDVLEALIGAIAISYDRLYKRGSWAVRKFIVGIYSQYFNVDPINYLSLYGNSSIQVNSLVQELQLDRTKLKTNIDDSIKGKIIVTITYDGNVVGIGESSTHGKYKDTAIKEAKDRANTNVIESDQLRNFTLS